MIFPSGWEFRKKVVIKFPKHLIENLQMSHSTPSALPILLILTKGVLPIFCKTLVNIPLLGVLKLNIEKNIIFSIAQTLAKNTYLN